MLEARSDLDRADRRPFFEWIEKLGESQSLGLSTPLSSDLTNSYYSGATLGIASELEWVAYRLRPFLSQIRGFRELATELDAAVWADNWPVMQEALSKIGDNHGISLWLIGAEIALRQQFEGLESQKSYVSRIRREYARGLPSYFAFHVSVRNEQRSTYSLFDDDYVSRLANLKMPDSLKEYLKYKIVGKYDYSEPAFSTILMHEQSQSVYDIYETTIDLLQRSIVQSEHDNWYGAARRILRDWEDIADPRVKKLTFALEGHGELAHSSIDAPAPLSRLARMPVDVWSSVWPLIEGTDAPGESEKNDEVLVLRAGALVRSILWRDDDFEESRGRLLKFARNFYFSSSASGLGDLTKFLTLGVPSDSRRLGAVALKSQGFSLGDMLYVRTERLADAATAFCQVASPNMVTRWSAHGEPSDPPTVAPITWYLASLRTRDHSLEESLRLAEAVPENCLNEPQRVLKTNLEIQLNLDIGNLDSAIALIAGEIARSASVASIMPAADAVGERDWDSLSRTPDKLDLAIALYAYWKQTDESLYATFLRFAFEEVLSQLQVRVPSEIVQSLAKANKKVLFFQSHICIPALMDTSGLFNSSDELLDERLKILQNLIEINLPNGDQYRDELDTIRAAKLIKSGLQIVDSNRVNVDTEALARWATKRYRESYLRYLALVEARIGTSAKFDEILAILATVADATGEFFTIPDSEADTLLLEMVLAIKDQFFEDPQYGLEYFLGKRIRHGSLAGHMRGPVESAQLITERRSASAPYEHNEEWLRLLTFHDGESRQAASEAFDRFSEEYDKLIADTRDRLLHVKSKTHPDGIFFGTITPPQYHLIKSVATRDLDFDGFLVVCVNMMWVVLDGALNEAKHLLTVDIKEKTVHLFARLQADLREASTGDDTLGLALASIQATSTEVQRQLDVVAGWFERLESRQAGHLFSIRELIEVAVSSALNTLTTFKPRIDQCVEGSLKANAAVLVVLADIVFVVLDNVYRRAKVGNEPQISIDCAIDESAGILKMRFVNPISDTLDREALQGKLEVTRSKIAAGDIVKDAGADRGSGLLKLAAFIRHYPMGSLVFGLLEGAEFETVISFPVVVVGERFGLSMPESQ